MGAMAPVQALGSFNNGEREEIMASLKWSDVEPLLRQFKGDGLMVSCYADFSVERGRQSRWLGPFKAKAGEFKKAFADDRRAWQTCATNLKAIRQELESTENAPARGMAVFSAAQRGFLRAMALDVPVENELVIHEAPYLVPLLRALYQQREYLVIHTDTHRGRLYAARLGHIQLLKEIEQAVPRKQHSSGERWGKQQATIARHRVSEIVRYQKKLVGLIEKAWADHPFLGLILLGEHEVVKNFRKRIPPRLAAQIVCEAPCTWRDERSAVAEEMQNVLASGLVAHEKQLLKEVRDRLGHNRAIAVGISETMDALQSGRLGPGGLGCLVLGPDPHEAVARCTSCRFLSVEIPAACPRCEAPTVEANLWEELLLLSLRQQVRVHFVTADAKLKRAGGVVALLPR